MNDLTLLFFVPRSNEAPRDPGEAGSDSYSGSQLVRPARMRDDGRRTLRRAHLVNVQSQIMIEIINNNVNVINNRKEEEEE